MKLLPIVLCLLLAGCASSSDVVKTLADAGTGCAIVTGNFGSTKVLFAATEKGAVKNATVELECDGSKLTVSVSDPTTASSTPTQITTTQTVTKTVTKQPPKQP